MRRIRLTVAYDGTHYSGWQLQKNAVTIEQCLNAALSHLCSEEIQVIGASRTDAGVHALGNIAVFDTESRIPADKFSYALNAALPEDIRVQCSEEVAPDYHPRHRNTMKTYEYRILNRSMPLPGMRLYTLFCHYVLNVEAMREAAGYLVGEHDFKSFCSVNTQAETTVRTIYSVDVEERPLAYGETGSNPNEMGLDTGRLITIRVSGNGFLYNMVRIIAGTLLEVGQGRRQAGSIEEILALRDRQAAGATAPACGLFLVSIHER